MAQAPPQRSVVEIKPQPDVYTVMLIVSIIALVVTIGLVVWNLMAPPPTGYGLTFEQLLGPLGDIPGK
ncbi:MAG: hypothetical protein ACYSTL_02975 [Planctomycetota bacterium]|jgi:hypothetical protein